jgi:hypothetical protein
VFLLPTLALVMVVVERLVASRHHTLIGRALITGISVGFIGSIVYVFLNPARHGPGYVITSIGLAIVGATLLAIIWWGTIRTGTPQRSGAGTGQRLRRRSATRRALRWALVVLRGSAPE